VKIEAFKGKKFLPELFRVSMRLASLPWLRDRHIASLIGWTNRLGLVTKAAVPFIFGPLF
jgi:hypothetical protein